MKSLEELGVSPDILSGLIHEYRRIKPTDHLEFTDTGSPAFYASLLFEAKTPRGRAVFTLRSSEYAKIFRYLLIKYLNKNIKSVMEGINDEMKSAIIDLIETRTTKCAKEVDSLKRLLREGVGEE